MYRDAPVTRDSDGVPAIANAIAIVIAPKSKAQTKVKKSKGATHTRLANQTDERLT